jgi:hypothetical protein
MTKLYLLTEGHLTKKNSSASTEMAHFFVLIVLYIQKIHHYFCPNIWTTFEDNVYSLYFAVENVEAKIHG